MDYGLPEKIYEKIKTPYKYGAVLKFEDSYCDSPVVFRYGGRWLMAFIKIDKECSMGYITHLAESSDLLHWKVLGRILEENNGWDACQTAGYAAFQNIDFYGENGTVYHFYCACNDKDERYIAVAADRELKTENGR